MAQQASALMKSIYIQRFTQLIPHLTQWYDKKQNFFEDIVKLEKQSLNGIEKASQITINLLNFIIQFLKEEKQSNSKIVDSKDSNYLFKSIQKHQTKKQTPEQAKVMNDIEQWNQPLIKYFNCFTEANLQQKINLKKFQGIIQQILEKFIDEEDNYKSLIKKSFKGINRRYDQLKDISKDQKKIVLKYYDTTKKFHKDTLNTITEIKTIQSMTYKQISILVTRSVEIKELIEKLISEEKRLAKLFKDLFTKYMNGYQAVYKESNNFLALSKLIEKIESQQEILKNNYFNKYLSSQKTVDQMKIYLGQNDKDNFTTIMNFLKLPQKSIASLIQIQKKMTQLLEYLINRKWNVELCQGWIIESWVKCVGCITLDGHFVIFDKNYKVVKVINAKQSSLFKKQSTVAFVSEQVKGIFSTSKQQYKIRFENYDTLQEFELYITNQLK